VRASAIPVQVQERIRRAYAEGIRGRELVERFGLSLTTIMRVVRT
jgi:hypothetical protein